VVGPTEVTDDLVSGMVEALRASVPTSTAGVRPGTGRRRL